MPFGRGYYQSGYNNGACGIGFTPSGEPSFKTYKSMKHSKKKLKKMKKIEEYLSEDACATMGNTGGMGAVVSAQPSSTPGDVAGGTKGSGDIGSKFGSPAMKSPPNLKKGKKGKMKKLKTFNEMFESFESKTTFECSGSPMPYFKTKAEFFKAMQECGYYHTTLNKKTDMLICSTEDLGTLKFQKAQKYGIPIYTYAQAKKEMKNLINTVSKYNL